jgi:uncharacterized SAM-binding protein YcdF (DUF218 family)
LYIVTTPIIEERVATRSANEIYGRPSGVAKQPSVRTRWLGVAQGASLGVVFWLLLFTLGIPWVFHIGGLDGLLPSAVVGALLGVSRWRALPLAAVMLLSFLLLFVACTPIIVGPARSFIRNDPLPQRADAIVVLSAGVSDDGKIFPEATDRLLKGLELLHRGVAPVLVLSRESYIIRGRLVTSREDQERIVSLVPDALAKVIVSGVTHSTHDEAMRARALFRANRWQRVVVVTSPIHTRRACGTFERAGIVVSCAASDSRDIAVDTMSSPEDRVRGFQLWFYELAGSIRYRQLGWL